MGIYVYAILISAVVIAGFIIVVAGGGYLITLPLMIFMGLPPALAESSSRVTLLAQNTVSVSNFQKEKSLLINDYHFL